MISEVYKAFVFLILDDFALVLDDSTGALFWPEFFSVVKKIKAKYPFLSSDHSLLQNFIHKTTCLN
jgi:hypothetical protein